jgi:nucleoside-diphosphate-sugar epimerase
MEHSDAQQRTVLVSGGSGYLGGWCVAELLRRGHRVRTTVRDPSREAGIRAGLAPEVGDPGDRLTVLAADLLADDGWEEAVRGCDYVLHTASPFPPAQPKDPDELIVPAREGTLRVLRAALDAGAERVVITSSVAAIRNAPGQPAGPLTEADWTDPDDLSLTPYTRSKTIAEGAAWDLARERDEAGKLAVVNPGAILGPLLGDGRSYSLEMIARLLGGIPGTPRIGFNVVDVRDVASMHVDAMTSPGAGGERFVAVARFLWMAEVATILRDRLGEEASKVPRRRIPDLAVRAMALFDPSVRSILGDLGKKVELSSEKARTRLGWSPRPVEDTVAECARSLIEKGAV